jgi:hypothetical protein
MTAARKLVAVSLRRHKVRLTLPIMPRKFRRGDKRNYRRWHCWIEAVRALAAHYRDGGRASARRRRH